MDQREVTNSQMLRLRRRARIRQRIGFAIPSAFCVCLLLPPCVAAQDRLRVVPPLPVPRPHFEAPGRPAPQPSGPSEAAPAAPAPAPVQPPGELPPNDPYVRLGKFPREQQREILRRCASEWDRMKRQGAVTGMLWRDFLESCLPGQ